VAVFAGSQWVGNRWGIRTRGWNGGEECDLCYGVKRANASRSGTSQNPQTPTPNQHQSQKHKSHVLIV